MGAMSTDKRAHPPSDFGWQFFIDGPALYFGGRVVANLTPLAAGWRAAINPTLAERRFQFFDNEATGVAYVNAWAHKWQDELRDRYGRLRSPHPH